MEPGQDLLCLQSPDIVIGDHPGGRPVPVKVTDEFFFRTAGKGDDLVFFSGQAEMTDRCPETVGPVGQSTAPVVPGQVDDSPVSQLVQVFHRLESGAKIIQHHAVDRVCPQMAVD